MGIIGDGIGGYGGYGGDTGYAGKRTGLYFPSYGRFLVAQAAVSTAPEPLAFTSMVVKTGNIPKGMVSVLENFLFEALKEEGISIQVPDTETTFIRDEMGRMEEPCSDADCTAQMAGAMGLDSGLYGTIDFIQASNELSFTLNYVSTKTGAIIHKATVLVSVDTFQSGRDAESVAKRLAKALGEKLNPSQRKKTDDRPAPPPVEPAATKKPASGEFVPARPAEAKEITPPEKPTPPVDSPPKKDQYIEAPAPEEGGDSYSAYKWGSIILGIGGLAVGGAGLAITLANNAGDEYAGMVDRMREEGDILGETGAFRFKNLDAKGRYTTNVSDIEGADLRNNILMASGFAGAGLLFSLAIIFGAIEDGGEETEESAQSGIQSQIGLFPADGGGYISFQGSF